MFLTSDPLAHHPRAAGSTTVTEPVRTIDIPVGKKRVPVAAEIVEMQLPLARLWPRKLIQLALAHTQRLLRGPAQSTAQTQGWQIALGIGEQPESGFRV